MNECCVNEVRPMIRENRQLVTYEPVEVQDCMKITDHLKKIYRIYPNSIKENRGISTCNRLDLETLGYRLVMPKNLPERWVRLYANTYLLIYLLAHQCLT